MTISVINNQMPMAPLFSPIYNTPRPYSQTRSNTARELMQPDEILRLDGQKCIALFQGHKPALLYKLTPEELPVYGKLRSCRVLDYKPDWKRKEDEKAQKQAERTSQKKVLTAQKSEPTPAPCAPASAVPPPLAKGEAQIQEYSFPDLMKKSPLVELTMDKVRGDQTITPAVNCFHF